MIGEILTEDRIKLRLQGETKAEVLEELVHLVSQVTEERQKISNAVLAREARMSTGVGKGVALPRARSSSVSTLRGALGLRPEGVDFDALDGARTMVFFLLVSPEDKDQEYVKALSLLARILNQESFREDLLEAKNEKEVLDLFREEEQSR